MTAPAQIEAWKICKTFGTFKALDDISLKVAKGDFLSLLGPSGSGKTTFLTLLAGFHLPSSGSLMLNGQEVTRMPPRARGFGMVFQGYALFPHLSVADNIAFPLKVQRRAAPQIRARVAEMIEMVGLSGHGQKKPAQLSGGQQQRVALARALACEPPVLLLDEPFSALDKNLRGQMQDELRRLHRELGTTFVFVTHDQEEALALSTRIAIFNHGTLQQDGPPEEIYTRPSNRFVAEFLGEINILDPDAPVERPPGTGQLAVRPENMRLTRPGESRNQLPVTLVERVYLGADSRLHLRTATGTPLTLTVASSAPAAPGAELLVGWETEDSFLV
ncbi:ABC transporter ATP-binding protein [Paenirhodobacter sp.]|uniref:ABC transporter ATP-binding protein n=1 Tax=Paenirhodobacter sp. TaxID=1965326 RepID=UPI003B40403E